MVRESDLLASVIADELESQSIKEHCRVDVREYEESFEITISVDNGYIDEIDELAIYTAIGNSPFATSDVILEIGEDLTLDDALDDDEDSEESSSDRPDEDDVERLKQDGLTVHEADEDEDIEEIDPDEDDLDGFNDDYVSGGQDTVPEYEATWEDVAAFDEEYGRDYYDRDEW